MIVIHFIFFFLLYYWFCDFFVVATKLDQEFSPLRDWATRLKSDKIENALTCPFCRNSHLGFLLSIPIVFAKSIELYYSLDVYLFLCGNWFYFFFGWASAGLKNIIDKK